MINQDFETIKDYINTYSKCILCNNDMDHCIYGQNHYVYLDKYNFSRAKYYIGSLNYHHESIESYFNINLNEVSPHNKTIDNKFFIDSFNCDSIYIASHCECETFNNVNHCYTLYSKPFTISTGKDNRFKINNFTSHYESISFDNYTISNIKDETLVHTQNGDLILKCTLIDLLQAKDSFQKTICLL